MAETIRVQTGKPHTFGWLRRPELDRKYRGAAVWELPDGRRYLADPSRPLICQRETVVRGRNHKSLPQR